MDSILDESEKSILSIISEPISYNDNIIDDPRQIFYEEISNIEEFTNHWMIAGGYAQMLYEKGYNPDSDIDVFLFGSDLKTYKSGIMKFYAWLSSRDDNFKLRMENHNIVYKIIIGEKFSIDFVITAFDSIMDVLESFDLDCSRCAFIYNQDEYSFFCTESFLDAISTNTFYVSEDIINMSKRTLARIEKYRSRGFNIVVKSLNDEINDIISLFEELKLTSINERGKILGNIWSKIWGINSTFNNIQRCSKRYRFLKGGYTSN